ncbi:MAG: sugar phosphate isomerase/epimerase [Planctomycetota bacterium]|nr:sugar phosphate isomerase/epimerase [Planctomycetota bacterium]
MKIGVFTTFTPEYTFAEACKLAKATGYEGVQPRIVPAASAVFDPSKPFNPWGNNKGGIGEDDFFKDPKGALKPAADAGVEITSVASYTSTADMDRALKMVKACAAAGIKNVRIAALPMPKEPVFEMAAFLDKSRGTYKELVAEAKKAGVRPCLELHGGTPYPSPSGTVAFLKGIDPADVGILYDPANMISDGWEVTSVALNIIGPYLAEVHVKNSKWVPDGDDPRGVKKYKAVASDLEDGCVNWAEVIEKLKVHGYQGWLIEEGHTHGRETYERLKMANELLRKLVG